MNKGSNYEGPTLEPFFAEAEMESEFGRARNAGLRRPIAFRRVALRRRPAARRPPVPFVRWRRRRRIFRPGRFPFGFPIPAVLDPSLWPAQYPSGPPQRPPDQQRPDSGAAAPPPSSAAPSPAPAEPPEPTAVEPPDAGAEPAEPGTAEPTDAGADEPSDTGGAEPSDELLQFFSGYEFPQGEFAMQPQHGRNGSHRAHATCNCQRAQSERADYEDPRASVLGLEALDTEYEAARFSEPEWEHGEASTSSCPAFTPIAVENPGGSRVKDKRIPSKSDLVTVRGAFGAKVPLHRLAAAAHKALVCAARADGIKPPLLLPTGRRSGFRDPKQQMEAWKRAVKKYGSEKAANKWVARPGSSAHQTGRAIDFYMGLSNSSSNVDKLRKTRAYNWMVTNAQRFGFYPYKTEPWHWEYNPASAPASEVELYEFFTPYAHGGRFPGRFRYGQGLGHRRRHPRV